MPSTEPYTVSKMLASINEVMAPVASTSLATVSLKRKLDNGVMLDTSPSEIALLDLQAKCKHAAREVAAIHQCGGDTRAWVNDIRCRGNDLFNEGRYRQAAELYVQALTGLDFGTSLEDRRLCEQEAQVPLTCNLVACLLKLNQWDKAKQVCDVALRVDPNHIKVRSQRAKALCRLGHFDDARAEIQRALSIVEASGSAQPQRLDQRALATWRDRLETQRGDVNRCEAKERAAQRRQEMFESNMMQKAVGRMYDDKRGVIEQRAALAASEEIVPQPRPTISRWIAYYIANAVLFVARLLTGKSKWD